MKELIFETENESFIGGWFIDESLCDGVLDFFLEPNYFPVKEGVNSTGIINKQIKDSYDKSISPVTQDIRIVSYLDSLSEIVSLYTKKYNYCNDTSSSWIITENINIQWYPCNGGYKLYHFERNGSVRTLTRFLTFMTYLNDVTDAGETEFYYQKLKVKPQKGLTLIWPVDWTHTHKGNPSPSQEKAIITGWYSFV